MSTAYIGLGSNIGDREGNCRQALALLKEKGITIKKESSMHETEPWGKKDQPKFINMAVEIETELEPEPLLKILKGIEKELGREETGRWGPRLIDLDLLLYDNMIIDKGDLKIPHRHMHERDFVLAPLCEIAEDTEHPVLRLSARELLQKINRQSIA